MNTWLHFPKVGLSVWLKPVLIKIQNNQEPFTLWTWMKNENFWARTASSKKSCREEGLSSWGRWQCLSWVPLLRLEEYVHSKELCGTAVRQSAWTMVPIPRCHAWTWVWFLDGRNDFQSQVLLACLSSEVLWQQNKPEDIRPTGGNRNGEEYPSWDPRQDPGQSWGRNRRWLTSVRKRLYSRVSLLLVETDLIHSG